MCNLAKGQCDAKAGGLGFAPLAKKLPAFITSSAAAPSFTSMPANHDETIAAVNSHPGATWTAGKNSNFEGKSMAYVKNLCGTFMNPETPVVLPPAPHAPLHASAIPASFNAATNWANCPIIAHVRDQANCGSCWAFGSTEAFNDRLCIASKGAFQKELSAADTTSCCDLFKCFSMGCGGGQPSAAWSFFVNYGVVTGGDYSATGKGDTCLPYFLPSCSHHVVDPKVANCSSAEPSAPSCASACSESAYGTPYASDKVKAKSSYSLSSVAAIQSDIMQYGSVTGAFTVYADFPTYKSGVYKHVTGAELGGHAIKIYGWGTENGTDFWLVMNSWNPDWGMGGSFKIARGTNECGIESQVSAGLV